MSNSRINAIFFEGLFELVDPVNDLNRSGIDFLDSNIIEFGCLLVFELELALFPLFLVSHVLLPVFDTLGEPLLHETSVSLELVDLGPSDLLSNTLFFLSFRHFVSFGFLGLSDRLVIELFEVIFHIHGFLRLVESLEAHFEEGRLHFVVGILVRANLESRLIVANLARFPENGDVCWRVDFFEDHLELVEKTECETPLLLHDLVHLPRIKFDVQVSERGLELFKVLHLRGNVIPNFEFKSLEIKKDCNLLCGEFCEIILLVELVKKFTEQKSACKIFLEVRDFL